MSIVGQQVRQVPSDSSDINVGTISSVQKFAHSELDTTSELLLVSGVLPRPQQEIPSPFTVTTAKCQDMFEELRFEFARPGETRVKQRLGCGVSVKFFKVTRSQTGREHSTMSYPAFRVTEQVA
jgi:hypothetical protein